MNMNGSDKIKTLAYSSIVSIFLFVISLYIYGIETFRTLGLESETMNTVLIAINSRIAIFNNQLLYKFLVVLLLFPALVFGINKPLKRYNNYYTIALLVVGLLLFFIKSSGIMYIILSVSGFICLCIGCIRVDLGEKVPDNKDVFNDIEEAFPQEEEKKENQYSVNLPMYYYLKNTKGKLEKRHGYINIINVFRGTLVMGTPGSGKTFCVIEPAIQQLIAKGFCTAVYDFKYPTLAKKVYNYFQQAVKNGAYAKINNKVVPRFYVINFDNPAYSNRANPIHPSLLRDDIDAINVAINVMCALVPQWRKEADFFANSAMNIYAAITLFLRITEGGKYCTFAHTVELLSVELDRLLPILLSRKQLENITKPFSNAFISNAVEQIQGQIASAQIPLARLATENVYYVCTGNDFSLDINDPLEPKVLVVGNNTQKVEAYATPLSLYFYQIIQQVNQQNKWPSCLCIDEFPTIYLSGIDRTINTARSNRVSVILGYQDNTQLMRDYGEAQAKVIINTPGNIFSGQVQGETADMISKFFGKKIQQRRSHSISEQVSMTVNEQMEDVFPPSKISNLSQGEIIGKVADNFDQKVKEKLFSCTIDTDQIKVDESNFEELPIVTRFPKEAPREYIQEWFDNYSRVFGNPDVDQMMHTIMEKADDDNIYHFSSADFFKGMTLLETTRQEITNKFGVKDMNQEVIRQYIDHIIGKMLNIGFLMETGYKNQYYVSIWMRAHVRQNYYQIKNDVADLVDRCEKELLSDPDCLKYYRVEYLQRLQKQYGAEETDVEIDMPDNDYEQEENKL